VPTLAVAAQEEHLVLNVTAGLIIQLLNLVVEALPLGEILGVFKFLIGGIGAVEETKVHGSLYIEK